MLETSQVSTGISELSAEEGYVSIYSMSCRWLGW